MVERETDGGPGRVSGAAWEDVDASILRNKEEVAWAGGVVRVGAEQEFFEVGEPVVVEVCSGVVTRKIEIKLDFIAIGDAVAIGVGAFEIQAALTLI